MDHLVRLDREARELERLCNGVKSMVVRGSMERRPPHGAVGEGDRLYFVQEGEEGTVRATARVRKADSTPMLDQEASIIRIVQNQRKLMLTEQQFARWGGLRFLVFVEAEEVERVEPFLVTLAHRPGRMGRPERHIAGEAQGLGSSVPCPRRPGPGMSQATSRGLFPLLCDGVSIIVTRKYDLGFTPLNAWRYRDHKDQ